MLGSFRIWCWIAVPLLVSSVFAGCGDELIIITATSDVGAPDSGLTADSFIVTADPPSITADESTTLTLTVPEWADASAYVAVVSLGEFQILALEPDDAATASTTLSSTILSAFSIGSPASEFEESAIVELTVALTSVGRTEHVTVPVTLTCPVAGCEGRCVDTATDPTNCGGCFMSCGPDPCVDSVCESWTCESGIFCSRLADCEGMRQPTCDDGCCVEL